MKKILIVCVMMVFFLTGCGGQKQNTVTLVLASFGENPKLQEQVVIFNENHKEYQIEIRQYNRFEQEDGDGIKRLQREIVSGNGPDIINFGSGYSITDTLGQYTEDLFPYFEKLIAENETLYFNNILEAFSNQERLYAMPVSFTLQTYAGRKSVLGERKGWTIDELIACYEKEYERSGGSFLLYPGEIKKDVFGSFLLGSVENYVDWEKGTCSFENDDFKRILEFANRFPQDLNIAEDFSPMQCFAGGGALLYPVTVNSVFDISRTDIILGEPASYVGYPVKEGNGTVICPSELMLAISAVSEHKEIAWKFIRQFLEEEYQREIETGFPLNRRALDGRLQQAMVLEYADVSKQEPVVKAEVTFEGEDKIEIYQATEEQTETLIRIIESASISSAYDNRLHLILLEEADGYFSGDKTLEETVEVMQGRAKMYVGEF